MTGFICLDKPEHLSSFSAVARVKRLCATKKAGHTGTLDPMATGVLPIALNGASRFIELIPDSNKSYTARFKLGIKTDTLDITGKVLKERPVIASVEDVERVLDNFKGKIKQLPPMYSAISKDGVRLYKLARQGIETERPQREVTIFSLSLNPFDNENTNEYEISCECSSGTYIRTLIDDIGEMLGCGAVMTALKRTKSNGFSIEEAKKLEEIEKIIYNNSLLQLVIPVDNVLKAYPAIHITLPQTLRFKNGGYLDCDRLDGIDKVGFYRVYSPDNIFIGIGEINEEKHKLSVKKVLQYD